MIRRMPGGVRVGVTLATRLGGHVALRTSLLGRFTHHPKTGWNLLRGHGRHRWPMRWGSGLRTSVSASSQQEGSDDHHQRRDRSLKWRHYRLSGASGCPRALSPRLTPWAKVFPPRPGLGIQGSPHPAALLQQFDGRLSLGVAGVGRLNQLILEDGHSAVVIPALFVVLN
jgi:hypothetical protein